MKTDLGFWFKVKVLWPAAYRIRSLFIPQSVRKIPSGIAYDFEKAKRYWGNVPRAGGGSPFNTAALSEMTDETLLSEIERERDLSRKKPERAAGYDLAEKTLRGITSPAVLDYGSGIGFYGMEILRRRPDARVIFADINPDNLKMIERIARLKKWLSQVQCRHVKDAKAGDFETPEPFDFMISMGVLHHTPFAADIVRRLRGHLKPGGFFEVMLYNPAFLKGMEGVAGKKLDASGFGLFTDPVAAGLENPFSEAYDEEKTVKLFEGFRLIESMTPMPFYSTYLFRKDV